jgi:hypothetical protein
MAPRGYDLLLARLTRARRLLLWRALERAGLATTAGLLALIAVAIAIALAAPLYRGEYAALRGVFLGAAALLLLAAVIRIARSRSGLKDAALEAGRLGGERDDELLAALELAEGDPARSEWTSGDLRGAAVQAAAERAAGLPIDRLRRWEARGRWFFAAGGALFVFGAVALVGGARTPVVVQRIANPASAPLAPIRIRVEPGTKEIEGGESVALHAFVSGSGKRPRLLRRSADRWMEAMFADAEGAEGARSGERAYTLLLRNLKEDVVYRVRVGDQTTQDYALRVRDLPRATGYRVRYVYPSYTGLKPDESQAITADLAAPRGSRASLEVSANRSLGRATILFDRGGATIEGTVGERNARFEVPMREDARFTIRLEDPRGRRADLGPFDLRAIPDRPPTVAVLMPGPVEDVARDMTAVLVAGATDDHGVWKVLLRYRVRQQAPRTEVLHEEKGGTPELAVRYTWDLGGYSLLPGEEVEYQVGAVDGDAIDGPQTTWSDAHRLRFPSASEILASMEHDRDETIESLSQAWRDASELQQKAEDLSRDVGRSHELSWEQRQEVQKTLDGQEQLRQSIDKTAEQLSQDAEKLSQSRMVSAELIQKLQELHQLLSQIKDQALRQSMERLRDAMKKMTPQEVERALQSMKLSQQDILKNLERTIEMLKQIRTEERLEALSERAAEMERMQLALNDSLSRANQKPAVQGLAKQENQVAQLSQEERAALDSLAAEIKDMQTAEQASQLSDQLGPQGMQQQFQQTSESMEQGDRSQSQKNAQELARQLSEMRKSVDRMREEYKQRKKDEISKEIETAAQDLLDIEAIQEKMLGDASSDFSKRAETQKGLQDATEGATNRVGKIAKQTLFITPDIAQSLGRALNNQQNAVGRYSQQDLAGGLMGSKEAAIALNQAATGLLRQRESMAGAQSSTGFQEAMESIQNAAGQQQGLNQQTMDMMQGGQGGDGMQGQDGGERLSPGEGDALGRMAAEQEAIRRGLEDAAQKLKQGGNGALGNLDQVADDMKKVEQDLRSGRLGPDTVERQQKILSRLLDAPRSVEKRDYSRRRVSRPGVDVIRSSPEALSAETLKSKPSLAALLARGGRDPIAPRYRATVDEYFQSILEGKAR